MGWGSRIKKVGRAIKGAVSQAVNVIQEVINRATGIIGFIVDLIIPWPRKKLRLSIRILPREDGSGLDDTRDLVQEAEDAYKLAASILKNRANVKLVTYGSLPRVIVLNQHPPTEALFPRCLGSGSFKDHYTKAGSYFIDNLNYSVFNVLTLGAGAPITAFVVLDVDRDAAGKRRGGCAQGPQANYVVIDIDSGLRTRAGDDVNPWTASVTLAHEICHACGLWHGSAFGDPRNLMFTNGRTDTRLNRLQKAIVRNSRHVTYF